VRSSAQIVASEGMRILARPGKALRFGSLDTSLE
jgi:hypothetical protein